MDNAKRVCYNIDLCNMIISLHGSDIKGYPFKRLNYIYSHLPV